MIEARLSIYALASTLVLTDTLDLLVRLFFRRLQAHSARTSIPLDIGRFARGEAHVEPLTFV